MSVSKYANSFYIYGLRPIRYLLSVAPERIKKIELDKSRTGIADTLLKAKELGLPVEQVSSSYFEKKFLDKNHQGISALIVPPIVKGEKELLTELKQLREKQLRVRIVILDSIQDPHNFGAIIRTCDASGVTMILTSVRNTSPITDTVIKSSSGTALTFPIFSSRNLVRTIKLIQKIGIWVYVLEANSKQLVNEISWEQDVGIVLGSEGNGCQPAIKKIADGELSIPMYGTISSLNVSVAAGVVLYQIALIDKNLVIEK